MFSALCINMHNLRMIKIRDEIDITAIVEIAGVKTVTKSYTEMEMGANKSRVS